MFGKKLLLTGGSVLLGLAVTSAITGNVILGIRPVSAAQDQNAASQSASPNTQKIEQGEYEAKQLVLLMDTDKNGKISRAEFMSFMAAEFDRLDVNKDGELDVKELEKSQLRTAHPGGGHR